MTSNEVSALRSCLSGKRYVVCEELLFAVDDDLAQVGAFQHHVQCGFDFSQRQAVSDHTVQTQLLPVVFHELCAFFKVLLAVQTVANQSNFLEADLADDEGVSIAAVLLPLKPD